MQRHFTSLLLRPSLFSGFVTAVAAIVLVTISNWSYLLEQFFFYDYLFGPDGLMHTVNVTAASGGLHSLSSFISESVSYNVLILFLAVMVGVVVYIVLQIFGRMANDASATWESLHAQNHTGVRELATRWAIRSAIAITWVVYWLLFSKFILPFCILAVQVGIRQLWTPTSLAYIAFGTALTFLSVHMHTVFIRLLVLRPRVFGGNDELLADEFRGKQ